MTSFLTKYGFCFFMTLFLCGGLTGQSLHGNSTLTAEEKNRLIELSRELFFKGPDISMSLSSIDVQPNLENIPDQVVRDESYLDSLLKNLETNESKPSVYMNLAGYYKEKNQMVLTRSYYEKAYENLDEDFFEGDSAAFYSLRAVLKNQLGKQGALEDLKKSISINPNDSLTIQIYPELLMANGEFQEAREVLSTALDSGSGTLLIPYLKLISLEALKTTMKIEDLKKNKTNFEKNYKDKNYDEITDYSLIEKYGEMYANQLEIVWARRVSHILGLLIRAISVNPVEVGKIGFYYTPYDQKKLDSLISQFSEASGYEALNEFSLNKYLGYLYFLNRQWDTSLNHFNKAIEVFPMEKKDASFNTLDCHDAIMSIYQQKSETLNYRKAILRKIEFESDWSNSTDDLMLLAFDYFRSGMIPEADKLCKEVMLIDSNHFDALRLKAHLYFLNGENQLSQFYLENASKNLRNPDDDFNLSLQYAIYMIYNGNPEMAKLVFESLMESRGRNNCSMCDTLIKEFY